MVPGFGAGSGSGAGYDPRVTSQSSHTNAVEPVAEAAEQRLVVTPAHRTRPALIEVFESHTHHPAATTAASDAGDAHASARGSLATKFLHAGFVSLPRRVVSKSPSSPPFSAAGHHDGAYPDVHLDEHGLPVAAADHSESLTASLADLTSLTKANHSFAAYMPNSGVPCDVCGKSISRWDDSRPGVRCAVCRVVCHRFCSPLVADSCLMRSEISSSHNSVVSEDSTPHEVIRQQLSESLNTASSKQQNMRFTRSSAPFVRLRLEAERLQPIVSEPQYLVWIGMLQDFLVSSNKYLGNASKPWADLVDIFRQTAESALKSDKTPRNPNEDNAQFLARCITAVETLLLDHEFYAHANVQLLDIDASDFAQEITRVDMELFCKITAEECHRTSWLKKNKQTLAPNILACIAQFNKVTLFIITAILSKKNPTGRAALIVHAIKCAQACFHLHNFNGANAILNALTATSIFRLKKTWQSVNVKYLAVRQELQNVLKPDDNFANYRAHAGKLLALNERMVPFLGVYLSDLAYVDAAYLANPELRKSKSEEIISNLLSLRTRAKSPAILGLHAFVATLPSLTEEENYVISLEREPKIEAPVEEFNKETILNKLADASLAQLREAYDKFSARELEVAAEVRMLYTRRKKQEDRGVRWISHDASERAWDLHSLVSQLRAKLQEAENRIESLSSQTSSRSSPRPTEANPSSVSQSADRTADKQDEPPQSSPVKPKEPNVA
ncbi:hypothetical protein CAOG_00663 [Capsaspora owczarzaki ATCC 30864]|uniref:hypothetical protein n=1 Tax=Capsaspora owczarzaki (strain ATCC 30864) TaxID=595528 RepID=UPI000352246E|nr:hypothetical protein CAOG_00663 [Capsaspora owczarzaki ATCC 30864]|eukprot:XP_004365534.2 hypothetical protein CAOG_00663 [Capsaspora owczarzaki ATCC 30864]